MAGEPTPPLDRAVKIRARRALLEQVGLVGDDLVVERLEAEPAGEVPADLVSRSAGAISGSIWIGVPAASALSWTSAVRSIVM